jgi:predicted 2-oxoglutarate/Fe(II)-dependent dioxygenase YbiX/peroxiredoxin
MQQPAAYPMPGDKLQNFALPDAAGTLRVFANEVRGAPAILFALSDLGDPQQEAALRRLAETAHGAAGPDVELYAVAAAEPARLSGLAARLGLTFPLFSDLQGAVLPRLLAAEPPLPPASKPFTPRLCSYVLDPNQRVLAALRRPTPEQQIDLLPDLIRAWRAGQMQPQALSQVAPVLILPNVLEPALCERLIGLWHEGGHQEGSVSDGRQNVYAPDTKKNLEHVIKEPELSQHISLTMAQRIGPELKKVFNFSSPFRFEVHIVLSYQDRRQDFFGLHRDNHRPDSPRMFACSTNLNDDYEGGTLHFPEYGPHGYRPPAGGSAVFSCNLLHEARPVTRGQRFAMTSFFCLANQPLDKYPAERRRQMQV